MDGGVSKGIEYKIRTFSKYSSNQAQTYFRSFSV